MKYKLHVPKIVLLILLFIAAFLLIQSLGIAKAPAPAWYAPLTGITYHSDSASFLLDDGSFEIVCGGIVCQGQFEKDFPSENEVLDPQRNLYSFSFRTPCDIHTDHSFYFTIYPNDLGSFSVNVETESTDSESLWLTANNPAVVALPRS